MGGTPHSLALSKLIEAVKQHASFLFLAAHFLGLVMELNTPKVLFRTVSEYMTRRGAAYTAATGYPFPRPMHTGENFLDTEREMAKLLELWPPVSIADPPRSVQS